MTAVNDDLQREMQQLEQLLGDTRARYHLRRTPFASSESLIELDREIRTALAGTAAPPSSPEIHQLIDRLRALDPR